MYERMDSEETFDVINPAPRQIPVEDVKGMKTIDYTFYDPLEYKMLPLASAPEMREVKVFKLFSNELTSIPRSYEGLSALEQLYLCCNSSKPGEGLPSLPTFIGQMSQLRLLNLVGNQFQSFPSCLCNLTALKTLYMNDCNLTSIPKEIGGMRSLSEADLSDNDFSREGSLPDELFSLPELENLYLTNCRLQTLPPGVGTAQKLEGIRLGNNELSTLPDGFYDLKSLKKFYAERNQLTSLSPKICQLQKLQFLLLMENKLTSLPDEICQLNELLHLNLSDNRLTSIPRGVTQMERLATIQLDKNSFLQRPPLRVCVGGLDSIRGFFDSFDPSRDQPIHSRHLKVVLLGESKAGKSCLVHALIEAKAKESPSTPEDESTVGVEIHMWKPPMDTNPIEFKIVDCAGQRRYQLTHPFFLSEEALHLVVFNLYKYEANEKSFRRDIGDWLDMVSYRISKPRIMIIPTRLDKFASSDKQLVIDRCLHVQKCVKEYLAKQAHTLNLEIKKIKEIQKREAGYKKVEHLDILEWQQRTQPVISSKLLFSDFNDPAPAQESYIAIVPISNKNELMGVIRLKEEIIRVAQDEKLFPSVGRDLPPSWVKLEEAIKQRQRGDGKHFMSFEDFENFAKERSGLQGRPLLSAVQYFDNIGELKYYKKIPSLDINVFLNLEWLVKLMKLLFRHDHEQSLEYSSKYIEFDILDREAFTELTENLSVDALLSLKLLRCIWMEMELGDMFDGMVNLLEHFGLACKLPSVDPDRQQILVPWFLDKVPEDISQWQDLPDGQVEVKLMISTLSYLPPALFDRLRVKGRSLCQEQHNWDNGMLLCMDDIEMRVEHVEHANKPPTILLTGRGPQVMRRLLWSCLLKIVQEASLLLQEWRRLALRRYSVCPCCAECRFECDWLRVDKRDIKELKAKTQRCRKQRSLFTPGSGIDIELICPPEDVVNEVLGFVPETAVTDEVSERLFPTLARDMADCWSRVALRLGFKNTDVTRIKANQSNNVTEQAMTMLSSWFNKQGGHPTKSELIKAFQEEGREDLVKKVRNFTES